MNYFLCPRNLPFSDKSKRIIVLSGTASYAKNLFLSSICTHAEKSGIRCEKYLSKYDYDKISAVHIKSSDTIITDSIYFNKIFSNYYKAAEIIDTSLFFKEKEANFTNELKSISENKSRVLLEVAKFENAARNLCAENKKIISPYINKAKILNYILRLLSRNNLKTSTVQGINTNRHISQTTPWGIHTCYETIMQSCKNVGVIRDEYRFVSASLISGLQLAANQCGYDTCTCFCSLVESCPEHLIIPELSLAFFTENRNHPYPFRDGGIINASRFLKNDISPIHKSAVKWNNELIDEFLDEAVFSLYELMELNNAVNNLFADSFSQEAFQQSKNELLSRIF